MSSIKKTDHFYLIDGSGYIFRAYPTIMIAPYVVKNCAPLNQTTGKGVFKRWSATVNTTED